MKKIVVILLCLCGFVSVAIAQKPQTYLFAKRDTCNLYMDVYHADAARNNHCCIIYVFGGGFMSGARNMPDVVEYAQALNRKGYTVVAIDYRLGLKNIHKMDVSVVKILENAIHIAVEDLYSSVEYILNHPTVFDIKTDKIVLCGSSAGAITVLQADYELCNRTKLAEKLPEDFHFGGVISFAGAIFSREGKVNYNFNPPAPTFFLHGMNDRLVTYKQIRFANLGFFGAQPLVKRFEKFDYPYLVRRYEGIGHEVASFMLPEIDITDWFIRNYVMSGSFLQIDQYYNDPAIKKYSYGSIKPSELYKEE
ncbi:MAG: alpha/beta hydrolase [Bacteroidales bacterium]|nr:alpha/beta hydrolase [Bacteroidales bacterium]